MPAAADRQGTASDTTDYTPALADTLAFTAALLGLDPAAVLRDCAGVLRDLADTLDPPQ